LCDLLEGESSIGAVSERMFASEAWPALKAFEPVA